MIPEFLAFRYQGLRRAHEILAKPTDLGWKCRKYIKWREVHNSNTDAKALYAFADDLIEKGHLKLELYGQISAICLNVQKWRLDKEQLSVEPPHRKEWEQRAILFKAAKSNPALISAGLSEHNVDAGDQSSLDLQILFYACELDAFFQTQGIESYPKAPISKVLHGAGKSDLCSTVLVRCQHAYRSLGITLKTTTNASQLVERIVDDLGFAKVEFIADLSIPSRLEPRGPDCLVELVALEKFRLIAVTISGGITRVQLNSNHPYIKSIVIQGDLSDEMKCFFISYANCMLKMVGSLDTLETFNSYLGLELHTANS